MDVPALRRRLLAWYRANARDLPWRGRDVYGVWVSEVMLQQTRVDVATPHYLRWMARFPTVQALAAASEEEVLRNWAGLGYYSRARNLHAAAKMVARDGWPATLAGWRALPGVGAYTAAAAASIAQGQPHACVDGNVVRVVARLAGDGGDVGKAATRTRIAARAQAWLAPRSPGDWNQAMMDLGATVCTPRAPRCDACPVATLCAARAAGTQGRLPRKARAKPPVAEERAVAVVRHRGKVLLVRGPRGLLAGMWSLPGGPLDGTSLAAIVQHQTGVRVRTSGETATAVHHFSHRTWRMTVQAARVVPGRTGTPAPPTHEARWVADTDLAAEAIPTATRVALAALATKPKTARPSPKP
ncbi:MAG: A/G-specific adenine glycosylase [Candidatus Thermoplasmatota archaeon]